MKARPPEYWGSKDEDPDTWIRRTEMRIRRKRVDRESDEGVAGQGGSERAG